MYYSNKNWIFSAGVYVRVFVFDWLRVTLVVEIDSRFDVVVVFF